MALAQSPPPPTSYRLCFLKSALFWLICSGFAAVSHGVEDQPDKPHYHTVNVRSLLPKPYCTGHTKAGSAVGSKKIVVASRNGPCSPFPRTKEISAHDESLLEDEKRVQSLNIKKASKAYSKGAHFGPNFPTSGPISYGGEYVATISLGTPELDYNVMIDTGSDYTWVRCKPCSKGCNPEKHLFDPSKSSTFSNGSCNSYSGDDSFLINYLDGSHSDGYWACDKLFLKPSDVFERFQFGCGWDNDGGADNFANADGILGLGRGNLSLVSQTSSKSGRAFSYCLPKTASSWGNLEFGDRARAISSSSGLKFTNLMKDPSDIHDSLYFVELLGISVAGIRLDVPATVFTSVGTVLDSGTVITYLPELAYDALSKSFRQSIADYPRAQPQKNLDTCFDVKGLKSIQLPEIIFHFGGATDVSLNPSGIVWIEKTIPYIWCLGFAASKKSDGLTIIGNNQQRQINILYDIDAGKIGFGTIPC